jgi:hypothetical protein
MIAEPPLKEGANHVKPICEADVSVPLFTSEVGISGI